MTEDLTQANSEPEGSTSFSEDPKYILELRMPDPKNQLVPKKLLTIELDGTVVLEEGADTSVAAKQFYLALELEGKSLYEHTMIWKTKYSQSRALSEEIVRILRKHKADTLASIFENKIKQLDDA